MFNKFYKRIHTKYSALFKFIFFIRYLLGIFFASTAIFLLIPNFFDYKKKDTAIKSYLLDNYDLKLLNYENIKFNSLPAPNLVIHNASMNLNSTKLKLNTQKLKIYPKLISIYNYENFKAKKIFFDNNKISLKVNELKTLSDYIYKLKNKLILNNLEIEINRENKILIGLKKINFSNYGTKKNIIKGELFNRKFITKINDNFKKINFKLLNTGINIDLSFNEIKKNDPLQGTIKAKVLNSNLKLNFEYDDEQFKIYDSFFRNKNLSFNSKSVITYHPFFDISSDLIIEDINTKLFKNLNIIKFLKSKDLIKKINSKNIISYKSKKFNRSLINKLNFNFNLNYGRLTFSKNFLISESLFKCTGNTNLMVEYPILNFNCSIDSKDKKKLLNFFFINYKDKNEKFNLNFKGNLNILNNKVNFNIIQINKDYEASEEDLKYFKDSFETVFFDKDFLSIFNLEKIKEFILKVI